MMNYSPVRRAYDAVALFALVNMAALAALIIYLATDGGLNGEKVRLMADVMRGRELVLAEEAADETPTADIATPSATGGGAGGGANHAGASHSQVDLEIMRREADRIQEELRQRLALNNSIMLRATTEREAFQREREEELRSSRAREEARQSEGFRKQVAILQAMRPKNAVEHLLANDDIDEAARVLLEMNTRDAKRIVEAARTDRQRRRMTTILQRVREVSPETMPAMDNRTAENQP